ncbi:MAG: Serine/threonine protein kinase, partial [Frankiales bacterium]|nr:Serine/threonine protein kinase [Frankiales bacterium]
MLPVDVPADDLPALVGGLYALVPGEGRPTPHGVRRPGVRVTDGVPVELEVLLPPLAADPVVRARLLSGADALRSLAGRHAVRVLHVVVEDDLVAVVRNRFPAVVLADARRAEGGTVSPRQAVTTALEVLAGLVEVHAAGLVHGALSERDVLMDTSVPLRTVVRVTGFGAAALLGRPVDVALPPGSGPVPVPADDVWAAGALLGQLLTARDAATPADLS